MIVKLLLFVSLVITSHVFCAPRPQEDNDDIVFPEDDNLDDRYYNPSQNRPGNQFPSFNQVQPDNQWEQNNQWPQGNQWQQGNQFQNNQWEQGNQWQQNIPTRPPNRPPPGSTSRPVIPAAIANRPSSCETNCLTTNQYNPVCGDDNVTYNNIGRLQCAANCGKRVQMSFYGRCRPLLPGLQVNSNNNRF